MTFKQFMVFTAVAKHLNITRAAEALRISQPAVSKQLKLLEKNYKATLFTRKAGGINLTGKGRLLLKHVALIQTELEKLNKEFSVSSPSAGRSGSLTVGGTYGPSAILLPSVLMEFKKKHPDVNVDLRPASQRSIERKVLQGDVEIAVVGSVDPPRHFHSEQYGTMESVAFVAPDHPLAKKKELSLSDLAKTPLIIRGRRGAAKSITEIILKRLSDLGFKINVAMRSDLSEAVTMAVRKKAGVGILYRDVVSISLNRGEFKVLKLSGINMQENLFIIYPRDKPLSANARDFLTLLRQQRRSYTQDN